VAAQFVLLALLFIWEPRPRWTVPAGVDRAAGAVGFVGGVWLVLGGLSLGRSFSVVPRPVVDGELKTGGLYRLSRHPIYTGLITVIWSAGVRAASPAPLVIAGALTLVLLGKARFEEAALLSRYPGYAAYAARTPRILPLGWVRGSRK
jgi:protein-S-isoprenylcysteine O-methyltransferase Ste14